MALECHERRKQQVKMAIENLKMSTEMLLMNEKLSSQV